MIGSGKVERAPVEEGQAYFELKKKAAGKQYGEAAGKRDP